MRVPGTWYLVYYKPIKPALERAPALPGIRFRAWIVRVRILSRGFHNPE